MGDLTLQTGRCEGHQTRGQSDLGEIPKKDPVGGNGATALLNVGKTERMGETEREREDAAGDYRLGQVGSLLVRNVGDVSNREGVETSPAAGRLDGVAIKSRLGALAVIDRAFPFQCRISQQHRKAAHLHGTHARHAACTHCTVAMGGAVITDLARGDQTN